MTRPARRGFLSASTGSMSTGMRGTRLLALLVSVSVAFFRGAHGQEGYSLNPPYFNLAEGARISATATCGQDQAGIPRNDLYCKLVGGPTDTDGVPIQNIQGQFCDYCYAADPNKAHPVTNAIDGTERWWQSPPLSRGVGYNEVNVTLDLGQLFHVAYILIKFANSPRPDLWVLERSVDHGRTYSPWQYFAHSKHECIHEFGKQPNARILSDDDQLCTTEYSRIVPLENGEIVVSLVNGRPGSRNFTYSPVLRDFTKATNIRLRFKRTSTLLGHLIFKAQRDPTVTRRYYYSIKDISVGGRCVCHGHAQVCGGRNQDNTNRLQCECKHNTCGESCDRCCPGFHQKPWRAATIDSPNECQPCQCFSHAFDCYYDPEVEKRGASLDTFGRHDGGGVCINCQHNTDGVNCERCREGFYRPYGVPPESPTGCIPCRCDARMTAGCEMGSGRCICRPEFAGENCDRCADGYYGFPQCIKPVVCPPGHFGSPNCQQCVCDYRGTVREVCDASGRCLCRQGVDGERCDRCSPGYHSFPECRACLCDGAGVAHSDCSPSGQCFCRSNYEGQRCDKCAPGYYGYPTCAVCPCTPEGSHGTECDPLSGQCVCLPGVVGPRCDRCAASGLRFPQCSEPVVCPPGYFGSPNCQQCVCDYRGTVREVCDASGRCLCRQGVHGERCDRCSPGYHSFPECREPVVCPPGYFGSPNCQQCVCDYRGTVREVCDASGRCLCRQGVHGERCDRCSPGYHSFPECREPVVCPPGYFGSPNCQQCVCDNRGTVREVCDASGRCLCRQGVHGERCDRCSPGYHSFPECHACLCDGAGVAHSDCSPSGQCFCRSNYEGQRCDKCAPGYYGYPTCAVCPCTPEGSHGTECDPLSGQCVCLPGVVGQRCDRCAAFGLRFPQCSAAIILCNPAGSEGTDPLTGSCRCRPNVAGTTCDTCKRLYWNMATNNPDGCTECGCDVKGTLSGVGECDQKRGQCYCKPNVCGQACDSCKEGFFLLQKRNYFGCQGCQCDVGGAVGVGCDDMSGQCQCRKNVVGRTCNQPTPNYYFPTLHQLKFEAEDGTTPNARPVRFGYDPQEFPEFSWRGYAVFSPAQNEIRVPVHVDPRDGSRHLFRVVLRFTNPSTVVRGSIKATNNRGTSGPDQSKEVVFPKSPTPTFLTVPGEGFAEPFALTPGKWIIHIKAQGILLDYLVLLPQDYYEAPLLQEKITQPCTYLPNTTSDTNCLLYKHVAMDGFSSALGSNGRLSSRSGRRGRQELVRRPTPDHPEMAVLRGRQVGIKGFTQENLNAFMKVEQVPTNGFIRLLESQLQLSLRVPRPGLYALVLEYVSEVDTVQNANLLISGQPARVNIYSCAFSFMCRSVAVDGDHRVARLQLTHTTELLLQTSTASFLLYKVYAVPAEEFSMEYVDPKVLCVSVHGRYNEVNQHCVQLQFHKPPTAWILDAVRDGQRSSAPGVPHYGAEAVELRRRRQSGAVPVREPQCEGVLLKHPQTQITFTPRVPLPGRYVVVLHYHQPEHISFPVEVKVDAGRDWPGSINASFCPAVSGCREVVIADGRIALDFKDSWRPPSITVTIPPGKTLELHYILLVPDGSYTPDLLKAKPLDKSADFMQQCRGEAFYIDPRSSSQFCKDSARSLVAAYNDGALPCNCDTSGSTGAVCDPAGGQCPCRQHVIGRRCTKCATGYYGFPYCKPCECGRRRLCDEVTGHCICPPQTIRPACDVCRNQTFSYHPLLGCEGCNCSPTGIKVNAGPDCDRISGQCTCKPRIGGRQCDRCAAGYYRFPNCLPCNCKRGGVTPDICDPDTGKCLCKRNVAGKRCDTCREGSFYFDSSDPKGCTGCFCFGATDRCQSSSKRRGKFVKMRGWRLERPDHQQEIPTVHNPASNTVVADVQELPAAVQELHWVAPPSYLGDRVSSYGGFLTYQSKSFGIPSEGMTLMDRRPDILLSGHNLTLIHMSPQLPSPDRLHQGRVQLVEGNWRHAGTNRPVSREELMMVLANLADLRIRALYFTQTQRLSLGEVGMEETTTAGSGGPGNLVEDCSCPPQYTGDSCEKCAPGHYREGNGLYLGRCVPCDCNGLADECHEKTGRCLNCRHNTAGDHCERCKEGFYGNAAQRSCKVCPCPFGISTNSFAVGCREITGELWCTCRAGYTGDKCERCAPGYYGDPLTIGGSCQPCKCNGNGNNCDARTGVCKNTLEPKDTNIDDHCRECGSCAQTLLHNLEKLDEELRSIKSLLDNITTSASSHEDLQKLEKALSDTKILVNKFNSSINTQKSKVKELDQDMTTLEKDVDSLEEKADKRAADADKALAEVEKTHKRAKQLDVEVRNMLKKIQAMLDQLKDAGTSGGTVVSEDLAKMLEDAERMVKEMQKRNFTPQKTAAEIEREAAKKLLDYIKANVSKQCDQNEAAADKLRGLLQDYEAKLKDLDEALEEAMDQVKKANAQNGHNARTMEDIRKRIENLKNERKTVEDQMTMAKDELQKVEDLSRRLSDSKRDYEQLAAQLDGANNEVIKKVNEISKAAAQEGIVKDAEEHAKNLAKLAKELEDAVKNATGRPEVRNAKDAIDAYKNITDAINAAAAAANEAKKAADNTLKNVNDQKFTKRAKDLKENSDDMLKNAKTAEKEIEDIKGDLTAVTNRLKNAAKKKNVLANHFLGIQKKLKDINRDDINDAINEAKRKAALANETANNTTDKLNDIKKQIDDINITPGHSNLSGVMDEVDKSVKNLLKTIPSLTDKISEVENLTSQFSPANNISDNIKKIKELIEQARDAANRIVIPMKFAGNAYVEMRPPKNLDDLNAYTSMALSLQRPKGRGDGRRRRRQAADKDKMFVLYLGNKDSSKNYIGMVLRKNVLYTVYKLNGFEYEMKTDFITESESEPATFDRVDLHRVYQDVEVRHIKDISSVRPAAPITITNQGRDIKNLLDLEPSNMVFYVGGYPSNFTPPASLNYNKYQGCIEFVSFNDRFVSLYNFQKAVNINLETPCKRYMPSADSDYYEGTGYGKVPIDSPPAAIFISMTINSRSENGLLLYIGNQETYLMLTVDKGLIYLHSNLQTPPLLLSKGKTFPTSDWTDFVMFIGSTGEVRVSMGPTPMEKSNLKFNPTDIKELYIGGAPSDLREKFNITAQPFKGCVKNFKVNRGFKPFSESVGVSRGCLKDSLISRKAEFSLGSSLSANLKGFSLENDVVVSLGFKSTGNQGLILQNKQSANGMNLALDNGHVVLAFNDKTWKSNNPYNDGKWHYLTVNRQSGRTRLLIDDKDEGREQSVRTSIPNTGGSTVLGKGNFKGCLSNLYTRRSDNLYRDEDLSEFQATGSVLLDVCTSDAPAQLMLDRNSKKDVMKAAVNETLSTCALPGLIPHAYRMGGPISRLSYVLPPQSGQLRPHFSLDVRTRSPEGLLFFAATRGQRSHFALYMSKGRIRLSIGKEKEIFNREKYNDGKWHSVIFSLERKKFRLVVDGIRAQDGQLTNAELATMELASPVYIGNAPESLHKQLKWKSLPKQSVSGCVRSLRINGAPMSHPTTNQGAGPCFDGQTQKGAYFSGNGAHIVINNTFVDESGFELLFSIRPRSPTGLLLHVGDSRKTRYEPTMGIFLSVYMLRGEVVAQVNNRNEEFKVSVRPNASLCDGMFHKISVIKRKNVLQLHVDTVDTYKIGPPTFTPTLTKDPLYVGGIPDTFPQQTLPVTSSFTGCIQDMGINGKSIAFERLPGAFGPINLRECPAG